MLEELEILQLLSLVDVELLNESMVLELLLLDRFKGWLERLEPSVIWLILLLLELVSVIKVLVRVGRRLVLGLVTEFWFWRSNWMELNILLTKSLLFCWRVLWK